MDITVPPYARLTLRSTHPFTVWRDASIIGPDSSTVRKFSMQTAEESVHLVIEGAKGCEFSHSVEIRPSPYEKNSGIPSELSAPIAPPTIQELIRTYIQEAVQTKEKIETPEEFFDFGEDEDDDQHLLMSDYEYLEAQDEYPIESEETPPSLEDRSEATSAESTDDTGAPAGSPSEPPETPSTA